MNVSETTIKFGEMQGYGLVEPDATNPSRPTLFRKHFADTSKASHADVWEVREGWMYAELVAGCYDNHKRFANIVDAFTYDGVDDRLAERITFKTVVQTRK